MVDTNYIEKILVFLINLSGFLLAVWVYYSNKKGELNQWFAVMTFFVIMWVDFAFLANAVKDVAWTTVYYRLNFTFVALFLVSFYYFYIIHFFEEKRKFLFLGKIISAFGVVLAALSFLTDSIIDSTITRGWGTEIIFGAGNSFFNLYAVSVALLVIGFSIKKYIHLSKNQKLRVQYFSVGIFFFALSNIIFNVIFPIITGSVEYTRFGDYSAIIFLAFTAYAITRHNLMGVKTLLTQVIIIVMSIILVIDILFLSNNLSMQVFKIFVLMTFIHFGKQLIVGIRREEETAEKIRKANSSLAERNQDLHVLLDVNNRVGQNLDSKKISQDIVDSIPQSLKYLGYSMGVIVLYNSKKDCVYVYAVTDSGLTRRMETEKHISIKDFREHLSTHDDFMIKTIRDRKMIVSSSIGDFFAVFMDGKKGKEARKILKAKSFISVPLFSTGQTIGTIVFLNEKQLDHITQRSKDIIRAFSSHIGSAIENAQLYEKTNQQMKELAVLNRDLKRNNVKLKELLEMKNEFLHITSHQLRTPLTAIRGMISMWLDGDFDRMADEKRKEMLHRIYLSTERLNNITNDMLDALELEGGVARFELKKISLVEMIKDTIATLQPDYENKGLYLRFGTLENDIPEVEGEPNYLSQVFMNLVDNACKYTRRGGTEVDIKRNGEYVDVLIKDTGIGMDNKDMKKAFEKFTRGENASKENASGSGLGLFIVKKILDEHNGKIDLVSNGLDKGTTFKVSLLINQE